MLPQELIRRKRDGAELTAREIQDFVAGLTADTVSEAQAAAFAMAVFFRKMSIGERIAFTEAMRDSGEVLAWDLPGPVVDKHSTGGVGDNVSLMLAPALAACGVYVPMISGRGLGHTGGTLDKLDSIPGYNVAPSPEVFRRVVAEIGCAVIGQTADLAPADKRLYAIRDVTGTVESIDLITASILSKKLASGLDALILDVKAGGGAFMASVKDGEALARSLVDVANGAGCRTSAILTDMNEPLASAAGNAVEIRNACAFLTGEAVDPRLWEVTVALGAGALTLAGVAATPEDARQRIERAFQSGEAAERFGKMVAALGGPADFVESYARRLQAAPIIRDVTADRGGVISAIDARAVGVAVIELGGGRRRTEDQIDHAVGFDHLQAIGARIEKGQALGRVHANTDSAAEQAAEALRKAVSVGDAATSTPIIFGHAS